MVTTAEQVTMLIPQKEISYKPGGKPTVFTVKVINGGDRFASFQLDITPAGGEQNPDRVWYAISPEVSTKNPPGDAVDFTVTVLDAPIAGFIGLVNLTVRAFSMELRKEVRQVIRLELQEGTGRARIQLDLPFQRLQVMPLDILEIPVLVKNPNQQPTNVTLTCTGIPEGWFIEGAIRQFQVKAGGQFSTAFLCQPPFAPTAISKVYPLTITANHTTGLPADAPVTMEIMPRGSLSFECKPKVQTIPQGWSWPFWQNQTATFLLLLNNSSNLEQEISIEIESEKNTSYTTELNPNHLNLLPLDRGTVELKVSKPRPWIGLTQTLPLQVKSLWHDRRIEARNPIQTVELRLKPIVPWWGLLLVLLATLSVLWYFSWLNLDNPFIAHRSAVTSVQLDGLSNTALTTSNDQTLRKWRTIGFVYPVLNRDMGIFAQADKAMRVVRFRPVNNDMAAIGLENGEIQLWDLLKDRPSRPLINYNWQRDDRVFGLTFSLDSRFLFSSHGSGTVLRWSSDRYRLADTTSTAENRPLQSQKFDFAISDSVLVGEAENTLLVAGRFNQMALWNWAQNTIQKVAYPQIGGQDDYIQSVDVPEFRRNLVVTGDNQGFITVWDLTACLRDTSQSCTIVDRWGDGHQTRPVRSVAISPNGCYLVSGGDDGRVMFYGLSTNGRRAGEFLKGEVLGSYQAGITAVDVRTMGEEIISMAGDTLGRVRGYRHQYLPKIGCDQ